MSSLQNEDKLNNENLTVIEGERNKKVVLNYRTRIIYKVIQYLQSF
jgi:hypothetical protein